MGFNGLFYKCLPISIYSLLLPFSHLSSLTSPLSSLTSPLSSLTSFFFPTSNRYPLPSKHSPIFAPDFFLIFSF